MKYKTKEDYQLKLWQTRSQIKSKGVIQIMSEMISKGYLKEDKRNNSLLLGRIQDEEFIQSLINFNNSLE